MVNTAVWLLLPQPFAPLCVTVQYIPTFRHAVLVVCQPRNKRKHTNLTQSTSFSRTPTTSLYTVSFKGVFTCHHVSAWQPAFNLGRAPDLLLYPPFKASSSPHPPDMISLHQHSNNLAADDSETASAFVCVWNPSVLSAY